MRASSQNQWSKLPNMGVLSQLAVWKIHLRCVVPRTGCIDMFSIVSHGSLTTLNPIVTVQKIVNKNDVDGAGFSSRPFCSRRVYQSHLSQLCQLGDLQVYLEPPLPLLGKAILF